MRNLKRRGIQSLFPVQLAVLKPGLAGKDLVVRARTGTGKTLAFGLPMIEAILKEGSAGAAAGAAAGAGRRPRRQPRGLVLTPTRELCNQVAAELQESAQDLHIACFYGGVNVMQNERALQKGVDLIVATPGRLIDLVERGLSLDEVRFLVLDEADRMLDVGFEEEVNRILASLPPVTQRQTLLFSATLPTWVNGLTSRYMNKPEIIDLVSGPGANSGPNGSGSGEDPASAGKMSEKIQLVPMLVGGKADRADLILSLIPYYAPKGKTVIFTAMKREADQVTQQLSSMVRCEPLHGDISQNTRDTTLQNFRDGLFDVLVATDVAARGLDVPNVDLVIHYNLPDSSETFLHRSGRTARAGKSGVTVALFAKDEIGMMRRIIREVAPHPTKVRICGAPSAADVLARSVQAVQERIASVRPSLSKHFLAAADTLLKQGVVAVPHEQKQEQKEDAGAGQAAATAVTTGEAPAPRELLAAALAAMSGRTEVPQPTSILTCEAGYQTVEVRGSGDVLRDQGSVIAAVRQTLGVGPGDRDSCMFGKITSPVPVSRGSAESIAYFDLPIAQAKKLLEKASKAASSTSASSRSGRGAGPLPVFQEAQSVRFDALGYDRGTGGGGGNDRWRDGNRNNRWRDGGSGGYGGSGRSRGGYYDNDRDNRGGSSSGGRSRSFDRWDNKDGGNKSSGGGSGSGGRRSYDRRDRDSDRGSSGSSSGGFERRGRSRSESSSGGDRRM